MNYLILFAATAVTVRLATLWILTRNEHQLKAEGVIELGKGNSGFLAATHTLFYVLTIYEGFWIAAGPAMDREALRFAPADLRTRF